MNEKISIGIIDIYSQETLNKCLEAIPNSLKENIVVISNTDNKIPNSIKSIKFGRAVSLASMRNIFLTSERSKGGKNYFFIINSNLICIKEDFFEHVIKTASVFGTWVMFGPNKKVISLEEDNHKISLDLGYTMNPDFIFLHSGIIKNVGFFNEQIPSNESLDVLDYIIRCHKLGVCTPMPHAPSVNYGLYVMEEEVLKIKFSDEQKITNMSYGMFYHLHKFIPDPKEFPIKSQDELFSIVETLQQKYSKPL